MIDTYTPAEFNNKKQVILQNLISSIIKPLNNPQSYFIVGQPGAGKTTLANIFASYLGGNVIFISGDDYRKFHPRYKELHDKYGDDAVLYTQDFSGKMTKALINDLSTQKYNLIIEGTLRTFQVPVETKKLLTSKGYSSTLAAILVRPEISYLSTIKRYLMMKEFGTIPRQTPKEHHDLVVASIIKNLDIIYKNKFFTDIQIFTRESNRIYNMQTTPDINPADIFNKEFGRGLTSNEINLIINDYKEYVSKSDILQIIDEYKNQIHQQIPFWKNTVRQ